MLFPSASPVQGKTRFLPFLLLCLALALAPAAAHAQTASQIYAQGVEAYNKGDTNLATQKLQLALQADKNFRPASALLARMAKERQQAAAPVAPGMSAKALAGTIVPVEFNNTTLTSALEYIRQKALEDSGGKVAINFAVNLPPDLANKKVTLKMEHVPVMELLRYLGEMSGVSFDRQQYAIVVTPAAPKPAAPGANPAATPAS